MVRGATGGDVIGSAADDATSMSSRSTTCVRALERGNGNLRWQVPTDDQGGVAAPARRRGPPHHGCAPALTVFEAGSGTLSGSYALPADLEPRSSTARR